MAVFSQLGPYYIDELLAEGGMARVFRARLRGLGGFEKTLVIKQIRPELAKDPRFVELFVREANTLVSLSHPHIVPVYELGAAEGSYYLSMEYVDGVTVLSMLEQGPLAPELVAHLGAQICDALDYAHGGFGILHRDITPRNILVDRGGHARLLDFGIAGALGVVEDAVLGSPGYMAPEQARKQTLSPATDLFALGAVLFEALTGQPAFEKLPRGSLAAPPAVPDSVPKPLARLVGAMLAQAPEGRPQQAAEVGRQLRGFLAQAKPEGVLVEMQARVQAALGTRQSPAPAPGLPETAELTGRVEAQPIATSNVLTALLRSAPGVALPVPPDVTRPLAEEAPRDRTNARPTAWMLRAWPWLAGVLLVAFGWLAVANPPPRRTPEPAAPKAEQAPPAPVQASKTPEPAVEAPATRTPVSGSPGASGEPPRPSESGAATLSVNATPWAEVSLDGRVLGSTPLRDVRVKAGSHLLKLRCPPLGKESELRVQIAPQARARVSVDLGQTPPRTFLDGLEKVR